MIYIICNNTQKTFFEKLIAYLKYEEENDYRLICDDDEFKSNFLQTVSPADLIILEISLNWQGKKLQDFYGIDLASSLRRDFFVKCPIIFFSSLRKSYFEKSDALKLGLLETKGSGLLTFPFSIETLKKASETSPLTDTELNEIVLNYCGLQKEWRLISHTLGGLLQNYQENQPKIYSLVGQWCKTITRFAAGQISNFEKFRQLLNSSSKPLNIEALKLALQNLDEGLTDKKSDPSQQSLAEKLENLPKYPPKGFSKILIADDEPLDSLISGLQNEYRYEVVGQAKGSNEAERLLNEKKPDVVLSDFYFKKYTHDTTTDKKFGENFMMLAKRKEIGSKTEPKNPIVAVISKTTLDPLEIPTGVLNCSGAYNATNPEFIHNAIWAEAKRRGMSEPETIAGQEWKLEYRCRQRLEPYKFDLPKITRQWNSFKDTIQDTLELVQIVPKSKIADEIQIINSVIDALKPYANSEIFSFQEVTNIFVKIETAHKKAKEPPSSEIKTIIRSILHGKIEQFSCVTNHINFARKVFYEVALDLISLPQFSHLGHQIRNILHDFSEEKSLTPFLSSLDNAINSALEELPEIPKVKNPFKSKDAAAKKKHIIVVEDNKSWSETVISSIEKAKLRLGKNFEITYRHFDNAADALDAVPKISNTPVKNSEQDDVRTIAIVDICLPENNEKTKQVPHSKNGIELIRNLSSYKVNIPLIVFSTKASLEDIKTIGKFGIPDGNFIVKDFDAESALLQSLISIIEKKDKFIIRRLHKEINGKDVYTFLINELRMPFSKELNTTFQALYELKEEGNIKRNFYFTAEEIYLKKIRSTQDENLDVSKGKKRIHDQLYDIREMIHETFQKNNRYIDVRDLIKSRTDDELNESWYELNAELPSIEDEEYYQEDYAAFRNRTYNILVISKNDNHNQIISALEKIPDTAQIKIANQDFAQAAADFHPDIICVGLEQVDCLAEIRSGLPNERLGVIVTTTNTEKNKKRLLAMAIKYGVPNASLVLTNEKDWINSFLTKLNNEKQRVFLGEIANYSQEINEPLVEILDGSDLRNGVLNLKVNDEPFTMNKSNISKIIGFLLLNHKTLVSFETLKKDAIGNSSAVTEDDRKGWKRKIRNKIQTDWVKSEDRKLVMNLLESSSDGMKLNVQVINSQTPK